MKVILMFGIIVLFIIHMPIASAESLTIIEDQNPIASITREKLSLPLPGSNLVDLRSYYDLESYVNKKISKKSVNAKIGSNGEIIPEKTGWKLNKHAFAEGFFQYFYNNGSSKIEVPKISVYPKVDSELLSMIHVKRIGQYITFYNGRKKSRVNNISQAIEAIDNYVIFPGEKFSFNNIVGKRTEEKGYMKAPEIIKGTVTEGIGGGICQVSSTLFNAVDSSGMKIVERYSHSKRVPYVPSGRDATVSWYGPDFVFENCYNQPVLIRAHASRGRVVVILYSSELIHYTPRIIPSIFQEEALP